MSVVNEDMGDNRAGTYSFIDLDWETRVPLSRGTHGGNECSAPPYLLLSKVQCLSSPKVENSGGLFWANKYLPVLVNK